MVVDKRVVEKRILKQSPWEYIIPALTTASLLISCIIVSSKKYFWNDELLSFYLVSDQSFTHMMVAWGDKFNQAPPLYFMLGWLWAKVFGVTQLALRLFSSLSLSLAFTIVWIVLRRTYNFWAATIGTLSVFCLSELIFYHNAELRMYGLFAVVCAFGILQFDTINRQQKCSWKTLSINSLIHAAMVLTHLYGVLYSAAILGAFLLRDRFFKVFRKSVYISVILSWFVLIPFIPSILNQANNSAKWFTVVKITKLIDLLIFSSKSSWLILALLSIAVFLYIIQSADGKTLEKSYGSDEILASEISLLILAGTFMAVPILAWIITITIKPMLVSRYIIPTIAVSWPILLAYFNSRIFPNHVPDLPKAKRFSWKNYLLRNQQVVLLSTLTLMLLIYPIYIVQTTVPYEPRPGINDGRYGYTELPIAMEAGHDFLPRFYYSSKPSRYFHILDWETAVNNTGSAFATGDYVHLQALSRNYPFINSVQSEYFVKKKYDRFLVLNEKDQKWFEKRIQNNSNYRIKHLGYEPGIFGPLEVFLVERNN